MDVEKTIEFILGQQAQATVDMADLRATVKDLATENQVIARAVHKLIEVGQENLDAIAELRKQAEADRQRMQDIHEDVQRTTDNVNALIKVVDGLVRRKNGDGQ
jgi:hypothetical protein